MNHKDVTATMPMSEYLRLKSLDSVVDKLTAIVKIAPNITSAKDSLRGYGVKYSQYDSLEEAVLDFRKVLGYKEVF